MKLVCSLPARGSPGCRQGDRKGKVRVRVSVNFSPLWGPPATRRDSLRAVSE